MGKILLYALLIMIGYILGFGFCAVVLRRPEPGLLLLSLLSVGAGTVVVAGLYLVRERRDQKRRV